MNWKAKNDTCGVPGKGYILASDYSQEDEDALIARAKNRNINLNVFMLNAGFEPVSVAKQLEIVEVREEEPKRKRRTREEIEADKAKE
jgi:hypothetical protein